MLERFKNAPLPGGASETELLKSEQTYVFRPAKQQQRPPRRLIGFAVKRTAQGGLRVVRPDRRVEGVGGLSVRPVDLSSVRDCVRHYDVRGFSAGAVSWRPIAFLRRFTTPAKLTRKPK